MSDRRYARLAPRSTDAGSPRRLLLLAVPVAAVGYGLLALLLAGVGREGEGPPWVAWVVAGGFALVATLMLYAGVRGLRGRSVPVPEVSLEQGVTPRPGARLFVHFRQPGPATMKRLVVKAVCERTYRRPVGGRSKGMVDDVEPLWEVRLFEIREQPIAAGAAVERELELSLPPDARPTGPALEGGSIRWAIEVWGEAGPLRAAYRAFAFTVQ